MNTKFMKLEFDYQSQSAKSNFWLGAEAATILAMFCGGNFWVLLGIWAVEAIMAGIYIKQESKTIEEMKKAAKEQ